MKRYAVIVADPAWRFSDSLTMSKVKRGAAANYATMSADEIIALGPLVSPLAMPDSVLALWVPSSMIALGVFVARRWGFKEKTIYTWVKTAKGESGLAFGMGRQFRAATEHALICTRGSPNPFDKAQRNVELSPALPHSAKPPGLQLALSLMYPRTNKLELFARRKLAGWTCTGLECPGTRGRKIDAWLKAQQR